MSHDNTDERSTRRQLLAAMGSGTVVGLAGCAGDGGTGTAGSEDAGTDTPPESDAEEIDPADISTGEFVASAGGNPGTFDPTIIADATSNSTIGAFS